MELKVHINSKYANADIRGPKTDIRNVRMRTFRMSGFAGYSAHNRLSGFRLFHDYDFRRLNDYALRRLNNENIMSLDD